MQRRITIIFLLIITIFGVKGQTEENVPQITPVDIDRNKPQEPTLHYYDKHGNPLPQPVRFFLETDTVENVNPRSPYPLFDGVNVGLNFGDAILMAAGQKYGGFDIHAGVSLHNWFFPTLELGLGFANNSPESGNFTYKGKPSPYLKIGMDYNFLYKSNPAYKAFVGLRAGIATMRYSVTDVTVSSDYWGESQYFSLPDQRATTAYGEALGGIQVKIWERLSMGWTIRYHFKFHTWTKVKPGTGAGSDPWYIPGYGTNSPLGLSVSVLWHFGPLHSKTSTEREKD